MSGNPRSADGRSDDFRIFQNSRTQSGFFEIFENMAKVQYFQQFAHQPIIFRDGANPAFIDAFAETINLAIHTPSFLHKGVT